MALAADSDLKVSSSNPLGDGEGDGDMARRPGPSSTIKMLGVLVGLVVILGGVWIGFGDRIMLMFAGGDGAVPVIAADASPIKVRPENPGGMTVPNQGRLVYGIVDGTSTQPRVERLLPSPEKPVDVDQVLTRSVPEASAVAAGVAPRGTADPAAPLRLVPENMLKPVPSAADVAKLSPPPPAPATPGPASSAAPTTPAPTAAVTAPPVKMPPAQTSPAASPAAPVAAPVVPPVTAPAPSSTTTIRATPTPEAPSTDLSKSYRVQLAASRTEGAVEAEWDRLRRRHVDLLGELELQVTRIDLGAGKGIFYRLRVGPLADEAGAKTLCERLKQRKLGCLVVKPE